MYPKFEDNPKIQLKLAVVNYSAVNKLVIVVHVSRINVDLNIFLPSSLRNTVTAKRRLHLNCWWLVRLIERWKFVPLVLNCQIWFKTDNFHLVSSFKVVSGHIQLVTLNLSHIFHLKLRKVHCSSKFYRGNYQKYYFHMLVKDQM